MKTLIKITCPSCLSNSIKKNGKKSYGKQNYQCKDCKRQFIGDHALTYKGCHSKINQKICTMIARGCGVRDIVAIEGVSIQKVLTTLVKSDYKIEPKKKYYQFLEIDEFWTFVGNKKNKQWLIYAYDRETGEIVAYVWGKRNLVTAKKLRTRLRQLNIRYGAIGECSELCVT